MIYTIGHFFLCAACAFIFTDFFRLTTPQRQFFFFSRHTATILSGLCLLYLYAKGDTSLVLFSATSSPNLPFFYRISSLWSSAQGSSIFWVWCFSCVQLFYTKQPYRTQKITNLLHSSFIIHILYTTQPFLQMPDTGLTVGLNPLLDDISLLIHPPLIYIGYLIMSIPFAQSLSQHPISMSYIYVSCSFLTLGIILGSLWAHHELGWGGYWFWDPVENLALIPWILQIYAIHTRRYRMIPVITFLVILANFFFIRSGILTSIHSFAMNSTIYIHALPLLVAIIICWIRSIPTYHHSIYSFFLIPSSILFMGVLCALYPDLHIMPSAYTNIFMPISLITLILLHKTLDLKWSLILTGIAFLWHLANPTYSYITSIIISSITLVKSFLQSQDPIGKRLAHTLYCLALLSLYICALCTTEHQLPLTNTMTLSDRYTLKNSAHIDIQKTPDYTETIHTLTLHQGNKKLASLRPTERLYHKKHITQSRAAIFYHPLHHVCIHVLCNRQQHIAHVVFTPFITLFWLSGILFSLLLIWQARKK